MQQHLLRRPTLIGVAEHTQIPKDLMNTFLTNQELLDFTGCHSAGGQIYWLRAHGIHHFVNALGVPVVPRSCLDEVRDQGWRRKIFLTRTEASGCSVVPRRGTGIYFLMDGKQILYVGRTTNFFVRMAAHDKGDIPFRSVAFFPMQLEDLDVFEVEYITRFQPKYNTNFTENAASIRSAKKIAKGLSVP